MSALQRIVANFGRLVKVDMRDLIAKKDLLNRADLVISSTWRMWILIISMSILL